MADWCGPAAGSRSQRGFTLVEVLAAFVVFALLFATMMQLMSGSLGNARRASSHTDAALWAQSRMAAVGIDPPIEEGRWEGEFDEVYSWTIEIAPYAFNDDEGTIDFDDFPVDLYHVELTVRWEHDGRPRQAVFRTLRAATPENGG